jgi:O-antigen/teichoic acid export membrane protein
VNVAAESLTDRTTRAAQWRLGSSIVGAVSQLAVGVLLAHLLLPSEFGVVALAFVVLGLAQPFGDLGMAGAIVQRRNLTDRHVRTAFTFSVTLGIAVAIVMALAAPFGAMVMREPMVTAVLRWLALGFAIQGTTVVAGALLRRRLDFRRRFFIGACSYLVGYGGVAVSLALLGHGVWSLVGGGLAQMLLSAIAELASVRHVVRPLLARVELNELLHFGFGASLGGWINYLARNGDSFVVGRWMGAESLGLYNRAYTLMNLPFTYAASTMTVVLFPAFAQVQEDPARMRRAYFVLTRLTAAVSAPVMGTMTIVAPYLVVSLYGPRWTGAVMPLQILCMAGYFRALYHIGGIVAQSAGQVYGDLRNQIVYAILVMLGALAGVRYGLAGVAAGVGVAILYMFIATGRLALRACGTPWRAYLVLQIDALIIGGMTCGVALLVRLLFEAYQAPGLVIALAVIGAAAVPAAIGTLWVLSESDLAPLLQRLPCSVVRLIETVGRLRRTRSIRSGT